ncbi:MAG: hypothetical protein EOO07_35180 [Chitinophagaceae bacterium]|nr:MAG: hypothetical protein EOO07_35180 [Chitinophagaceae bacterium]
MFLAIKSYSDEILKNCIKDGEYKDYLILKLSEISELDLTDRLRVAILKISYENPDLLDQAINLYHKDWRDLLVAANLASDLEAYKEWAKTCLRLGEISLNFSVALTIAPNEKGNVRCPKCNFSFNISDSRVWDGKIHNRCGARLEISLA